MNARKTISLILILFLTGPGIATPDEPHRMFGEATDNEGDTLETKVIIEHQSDEVTTFETDSDGSYDIMIPSGDYESEELDILIDGETVDTVVFEPLGVTEKDLSYQTTEENKEEETDEEDTSETSGGGGGGLPSDYVEENNTTEENQTNTSNTTSSSDSPAQEEEEGPVEDTEGQEEGEVIEEENTSISDSSEENSDGSNSLVTGRFFQEQTNSVTILLLLGIALLAAYIVQNSSYRFDLFN